MEMIQKFVILSIITHFLFISVDLLSLKEIGSIKGGGGGSP